MPSDGIQDMLSQMMAPWHREYFKLEESEKMAEAGQSPSLPVLFSPDGGHKTLV